MKWFTRVCWLLSLWLTAGTVYGQSPAASGQYTVTKVSINWVGPRAVSDDLVRANIRTKVGVIYSIPALDDATSGDIRSLRSTGYFHDVSVYINEFEEGVEVIYRVQGKPVLTEIQFEGNTKYSRKKLIRKVDAKIGQPVDEYKLFVSAREIEKLYQKAGYYRTKVTYRRTINEQLGRGSVTFEITESPKIRVTDVVFVDAKAFSQRKLRKVIKTRRWWMFSWLTRSGKLKEEQLDMDRVRLLEFYQEKGYIDFEIKDVEIEPITEKKVIIRVHVFEGRQYKVGAVRFEGDKVFSDAEIRTGTSVLGRSVRPMMLEGAIFTPSGLRQDKVMIQDFYGSRGYIGSGSSGSINVQAIKIPNVETGTMDLVYRIEAGERSRVEKIEIRGNTKTRNKVLRRELAIYPGEVFNMVRVQISEERIRGMQFFSRVETEVDPTEVPDRKNLVINVEEGSSGNFSVGAGFSSIESLFGYLRMTQSNFDLFNPPAFTGAGQKLMLTLTVGTQQELYELRFVEPWFLDRRLEFDFNAYHRNLQYLSDVYTQIETGTRFGLTKALTQNQRLVGGINYTIENIDIDFENYATTTNYVVNYGPGRNRSSQAIPPQVSPSLAAEEGAWLVSKVGFITAYDTRGGGRLPNKGQRSAFIPQVGGGVLGGDVDFYKLEFTTGWYFKGFAPGHVFELVGRIGTLAPYGDSPVTHIWDRYYLGGAYTLRGYQYRDVGPRDELGEPIGGNTVWMGSAEYSIPIIEMLRFAVFYDVGTVNADSWDFNAEQYADDWGLGFRINIPQMGPIRLDYGFPITYPDYLDGDSQFQFSIGWDRPI